MTTALLWILLNDLSHGKSFIPLFNMAETSHHPANKTSLSDKEITRYSRQMLVPEVGVEGQRRLREASILVVGAGGLGCPVLIYLAGAGVGRLGIVDGDVVETSNLHRQVAHTEDNVGSSKATSCAMALHRLNSRLVCDVYPVHLTSSNASAILTPYDLVVDATDNVASRYLINDACVLGGKPLVSGSALRLEGQVTVYHYEHGPCYRCLFPEPPPRETVGRCSEMGVLGVVTGLIGCYQAMEAVKIILGLDSVLREKLLLYDGLEGRTRIVRLRPRNPACAVCGDTPSIRTLIDYEEFCGSKEPVFPLPCEQCVSVEEYKSLVDRGQAHILLDVRDALQFSMCDLPNSFNVPFSTLPQRIKEIETKRGNLPVYVVCRRGIDSQVAVRALMDAGMTEVYHVDGGLQAWASRIDPSFPFF